MTEGVESKRCETIESIISGLHGLLGDYRNSSYVCPYDASLSFQCGSFLLGALSKRMNEKGLLDPRPEAPFHGISVDDLCIWIGELTFSPWYSSGKSSAHKCVLEEERIRLVRDNSAAFEGLDLAALKE